MMLIQNTLSGNREELVPSNPERVGIYVCGPTTYNFIHLGNARPLVVFDTLRRYLRYSGYQVKYVQNFTDIDDKIINRAKEEGITPQAVAEKYIDEYFKDADNLGILRADVHPRVSEHLPEIIAMVEKLIEKGYAYVAEGDVYYRVNAFADYGKLSGRSLEDMLAGVRIEVDERKESAGDFALWKAAKPGEPAWDSPWGPGRPGWHIECSAMSIKHLGETIDIHGGGEDLIFPHHENEIAQSEAATGKPFAKYWMHNGFITVNDEKMSKSLGNFFILRDILAKYPGEVVRFYLLSVHYRNPLDFDGGKLEEAKRALQRLKRTVVLADEFLQKTHIVGVIRGNLDASTELQQKTAALEQQFREAMDDDLNTARAIGYLFEMSHLLNIFISEADRQKDEQVEDLASALAVYRCLGDVLGIFQVAEKNDEQQKIEEVVEILLHIRAVARAGKNYVLADRLRDILHDLQIKVEDTADVSRVHYEKQLTLEVIMEELLALRQELKEQKLYAEADLIREQLNETGIVLEDTREGSRWELN